MGRDDLRVAVAGAGIGGLCLAQGLRKAGVAVAVYERDAAPDARLSRYRLHLDPAGTRALRACLPEEAWRAFLAGVGRPGGGFGFLDRRLRELVVVEDDVMYPGHGDPADRAYPVDRHALRGALLTGLDEVVRYGKACTGYEVRDSGVAVRFADGTEEWADVLVGADGARSAVRAQLLPQARRIDTGAFGVGMKLPLTGETRAWLPARLLHGENLILCAQPWFLFTSVFDPGPGAYLLCAFVARRTACPGTDVLDGLALRDLVAARTADWHPTLRRLVDAIDPDTVSRFDFTASEPVPPWTPGPVTVLGDAIHLMPPTGGIGANTALRDAHHLAMRLAAARDGSDLVDAIGAYEADMRDYGTSAVRDALATLDRGLAPGRARLLAATAFFRACQISAPLRRAAFREEWATHARRRPWEGPTGWDP